MPRPPQRPDSTAAVIASAAAWLATTGRAVGLLHTLSNEPATSLDGLSHLRGDLGMIVEFLRLHPDIDAAIYSLLGADRTESTS